MAEDRCSDIRNIATPTGCVTVCIHVRIEKTHLTGNN